METINALEEELQTLRLSKGEEVEGLSLKYNQLNEAFEQQRNYSKQLEEQLQDQQQQIASAPLVRVNDQDRFDQQLMTLQQSFPSLTVNQVLELVVSCALHNEHSFFVHSLKEHTKRNPNFFTSKLPNHETSSF